MLANSPSDDRRGLLAAFMGDGRPLIVFTGFGLVLAGCFAIFQSATGYFLPHDIDYLGMTAAELCGVDQCRIVHFMFHDRVSFGGVLIAIGLWYFWLAEFPLRDREAWAWWLLVLSGMLGFLSFMTYLGQGYFDSWHAVATLPLLILFVAGMTKSFALVAPTSSIRQMFRRPQAWPEQIRFRLGRGCLLIVACSMVGAGAVITTVGMTIVFVPQDLAFLQLNRETLSAIHPNLIPLIAHDRAGFGGGVCSAGLLLLGAIWYARPSRSLGQLLGLAGAVGFGTAIGMHPLIGYNDALHLAPALGGAALYFLGSLLLRPAMIGHNAPPEPAPAVSRAFPTPDDGGNLVVKKILVGLVVIVALLLVVIALQPSEFRIERSATIAGPPETVFAQVNDFHAWEAWSPWAKLDPKAQNSFEGAEAGEGAIFKWSGNSEVGEGMMTINESKPYELIKINLEFVKPMQGTNETLFTFKPTGEHGDETQVTWTMTGHKNFMSKAFCLFMNMDKIVGGEFEKGLANMNAVVKGEHGGEQADDATKSR